LKAVIIGQARLSGAAIRDRSSSTHPGYRTTGRDRAPLSVVLAAGRRILPCS
jgi:hypothetical protein